MTPETDKITRTGRPTEIKMDVHIPYKEGNLFVELPKDPRKWAAELKKEGASEDYIRMRVDNLPTGCGGVGISFGPTGEKDRLLLVVTKETLGKMIHALQLAHDNYID